MSQPSGFVPVPFQRVGKVLTAIGVLGLAASLVSKYIATLVLPAGTFASSLALIVIGLYLIFLVPAENNE